MINGTGEKFRRKDPASFVAISSLLITFLYFICNSTFFIKGRIHFTLFDDAMISMRYAYNLARHGDLFWSLSSGNIEGITNLGWTLIMSLVIRASSINIAPGLISLLSAIFCILGILILCSEGKFSNLSFGNKLSGLIGSFSLFVWSIRGFEVSLLFLINSIIFTRIQSYKTNGFYNQIVICSCCFIGVLTRDDFAICMTIFSLISLMIVYPRNKILANSKSKIILILGSSIISLSLKMLARNLYFGDIYPNTYYLKVFGHAREILLLRGVLVNYGYIVGCLAPIITILIALLIFDKKAFKQALLTSKEIKSHLFYLSFIFYSTIIGGDAWEQFGLVNRFISTSLPFLVLNFLLFIDNYTLQREPEGTVNGAKSFSLFKDNFSACLFIGLLINILLGVLYNKGVSIVSSLLWVNAMFKYHLVKSLINWLLLFSIIMIGQFVYTNQYNKKESYNFKALTLLMSFYFSIFPLYLFSFSNLRGHDILYERTDANKGIEILTNLKDIPSNSKIVANWAGIQPYYRPDLDFIDPLGKIEPYIARQDAKIPFYQGHTKWDWKYLLSKYKPDFILGDLKDYSRKDSIWSEETKCWDNYYQERQGLISLKSRGFLDCEQ